MKKVFIYLLFVFLLKLTGRAQTITTYSILSTGYDRATSSFIASTGVYDPHWIHYQLQDMYFAPPVFYPLPGTESVFNTPAYVVNPGGMLTDVNAKYINYNPVNGTAFRSFITYRTYFDLPFPLLPANKQYSIKIKMRADDIVYDVKLNGAVFLADSALYLDVSGNEWGKAYADSAARVEIPYCYSGFKAGTNYLEITVADTGAGVSGLSAEVKVYERTSTEAVCNYTVPPFPCEDCIGSFAPEPGKKYLISAWVKEGSAAQSKTSYTYPSITVRHPSVADSSGPFYPTGDIIDGWQRIEAEFTIPALATDLSIKLNCSTGNCFFDDVRVFPFDGSMKSYVYDPVNMRLVAELDERNYATLYEYDEEGKLVRVKKETHKGVMTIKENRNHTKK